MMYKENQRIHRKPEFLKYLPSNWETSKIKNDAFLRMGDTILKNELVESGIPVYSASREDRPFGYLENPSLMLNKGDIVIGARGTLGFPKVMKGPSTCTQTTICISPKSKMNSYFMKYCLEGLMSELIIEEGSGVPQLTVETVKNFELPCPDEETKRRIVSVLDAKCSSIDSAISKITKEIEKLEEYKKAVITEAVTKGLNHNKTTMPSGEEWIGEYPSHWNLSKMKYVSTLRRKKADNKNNYIGLENIESFTGRRVGENLVPEGEASCFKKGDVLFGKLRPYLSKSLCANEDGCCSGEILVLIPKQVSQRYLFYVTLSHTFVKRVNDSTYGTKMPRASWDFIGNLVVPVPNKVEREEIVSYLDSKCSVVDEIVQLKRKEIEKLEQYKRSLIYECVTGKKEVPILE